jgi:hypothetical protein
VAPAQENGFGAVVIIGATAAEKGTKIPPDHEAHGKLLVSFPRQRATGNTGWGRQHRRPLPLRRLCDGCTGGRRCGDGSGRFSSAILAVMLPINERATIGTN